MKKLVVANFKMNGNEKFYRSYLKKINKLKLSDTEIVLCPPFLYLPFFKIKNKNIKLGAQDIANQVNNKSTSQISPSMLHEYGVKYIIIGHSERRTLYDNDEIIREKINTAISNNLMPIICVGEKYRNNSIESLCLQVESALRTTPKGEIIFAYEPLWAIGSGLIPKIERINKAVKFIKDTAVNLGYNIRVLYGGSVSADNYRYLLGADIDGFLCGGVSLKIDEFTDIIKGI